MGTAANPNDTNLRAYLQDIKQEELREMGENEFRKRGDGQLDLKEFSKNRSKEDKADMMIVQENLGKIIQTFTFRSWDYIIDKQQEQITTSQVNSVYEKVNILSISKATNEVLEDETPVLHKRLVT